MFYYLDNFLIFQFCGSLQSMFVLWWCLHLSAAWKYSVIAAVLRPATTKASSPVRVSNIFSGKWQHNDTVSLIPDSNLSLTLINLYHFKFNLLWYILWPIWKELSIWMDSELIFFLTTFVCYLCKPSTENAALRAYTISESSENLLSLRQGLVSNYPFIH